MMNIPHDLKTPFVEFHDGFGPGDRVMELEVRFLNNDFNEKAGKYVRGAYYATSKWNMPAGMITIFYEGRDGKPVGHRYILKRRGHLVVVECLYDNGAPAMALLMEQNSIWDNIDRRGF